MINIKIKNTIKLMLIASAFFVSCKKQNDPVGTALQEQEVLLDQKKLELNSDSLSLANIIWNDSASSNDNFVFSGVLVDALTGQQKATSYIQLNNPTSGLDLNNATCTSAKFRMAYDAVLYENRVRQSRGSENLTFSLREIKQDFGNMYNNKKLSTSDKKLSEITVAYNDTLSYIEFIISGEDAQFILNAANGTTSDEFLSKFKGLAIVCESGQSIVALDVAAENSFLELKYAKEGQTDPFLLFDVSTSLKNYTYLEFDKSETDLKHIKYGELSPIQNLGILQSGAGVHLFLDLVKIKTKIQPSSSIIINKAVITIPVKGNSFNNTTNNPVKFLKLVEANTDGEILKTNSVENLIVPDEFKVTGKFSDLFGLNETTSNYEIDITYYLQEWMSGQRDLKALLFSTHLNTASLNYQSVGFQSDLDVKNIRFDLYYKEIKQ